MELEKLWQPVGENLDRERVAMTNMSQAIELCLKAARAHCGVPGQRFVQGWLDSLPDNLTESVLAHKLEAICMLDLAELESIEPPRGFGRD